MRPENPRLAHSGDRDKNGVVFRVSSLWSGEETVEGNPPALVTTLEDERKPTVSAPRSDPFLHDVTPVGITPALYQVPSTGLSREEWERAMKETVGVVEKCCESLLGYQSNQSFNMPEFLSPLTNVMMNKGHTITFHCYHRHLMQ